MSKWQTDNVKKPRLTARGFIKPRLKLVMDNKIHAAIRGRQATRPLQKPFFRI